MSKRKIEWTENKLSRFIKEKRGEGDGVNYVPWLMTQDFPSIGKASRVRGCTTGRVHHFFSATQRDYFLELDWDDEVVDIREHYPLHDYKEVIDDLDGINIDKFANENLEYVITTTFLITKRTEENGLEFYARSVKYASELEKKITQSKLELERRYWKAKTIDWKVITNKEINSVRIKNLEFINPVIYLNYQIQKRDDICKDLIEDYKESKDKILKPILNSLDRKYGLEIGESINVLKFLLAGKIIKFDLNTTFEISKPITLIIND